MRVISQNGVHLRTECESDRSGWRFIIKEDDYQLVCVSTIMIVSSYPFLIPLYSYTISSISFIPIAFMLSRFHLSFLFFFLTRNLSSALATLLLESNTTHYLQFGGMLRGFCYCILTGSFETEVSTILHFITVKTNQ
jgi:hypothetical protein